MICSPKAKEITKYSGSGSFSTNTFKKYGLPPSIVNALVASANHSLAAGTFKSYKTAENHILRCQTETNIKLRVPFGEKETILYIGWLITSRKVSAATVEKYLSGIRFYHLKEGFNVPHLRPDIVKSILTGLGQKERVEIRLGKKVERLPVTLSILELIRHELKKAKGKDWTVAKKRLIQTVCLLANGTLWFI